MQELKKLNDTVTGLSKANTALVNEVRRHARAARVAANIQRV